MAMDVHDAVAGGVSVETACRRYYRDDVKAGTAYLGCMEYNCETKK
jgi:hypothetical protein